MAQANVQSQFMDALTHPGRVDETEQCLIDGADPSVLDADGRTTLMIAAPDSAYLLMNERTVDVHHADRFGQTALHYFVSQIGYESLAVRLITRYHVNVNAQDQAGNTPLHRLSTRYVREVQEGLFPDMPEWLRTTEDTDLVVIQLLQAGALLTLENNRGETILSLSERAPRLAELIAEHVANSSSAEGGMRHSRRRRRRTARHRMKKPMKRKSRHCRRRRPNAT